MHLAKIVLGVLGILFLILAGAAICDGVAMVWGWHNAQLSGHTLKHEQFLAVARNLTLKWLFVATYAVTGVNLWQRRRLNLTVVLLLATLVGQWMNLGYPNGFVLSFAALAMLAAPPIRASFRS